MCIYILYMYVALYMYLKEIFQNTFLLLLKSSFVDQGGVGIKKRKKKTREVKTNFLEKLNAISNAFNSAH